MHVPKNFVLKKKYFFLVENFLKLFHICILKNLKIVGGNQNFRVQKHFYYFFSENTYIFKKHQKSLDVFRKKCAEKFLNSKKNNFLSVKNFEIFVESQDTWKPRKSQFSAQSQFFSCRKIFWNFFKNFPKIFEFKNILIIFFGKYLYFQKNQKSLDIFRKKCAKKNWTRNFRVQIFCRTLFSKNI